MSQGTVSQYSFNDPLMTETRNVEMTRCRRAQRSKLMMVILALFAGVGAGFGPEPLPTNVGVAWVNCWAVFSALGIKLRMSQSINLFCFAACRIKSRRGCPRVI